MSTPKAASSQLTAMKGKLQHFFNLKFLFLGFFLAFLFLFALKSSISSESTPQTNSSERVALRPSSDEETIQATNTSNAHVCNKIPSSLAYTIIHYTTTNVTPQQTFDEISVTARVLERRGPCNFLVFGLGLDSLMWNALNHGGRTVFLEEDASWIAAITEKHPALESYHVAYDTKVRNADELFEFGRWPECTAIGDTRFSSCRLALKGLPSVFYEVEWDLIMVDAPTGWVPDAPGRMGAIYTAGMAARMRRRGTGETDVFVHDVDRVVEDKFSKAFLCEGYLKEQVGRLRHFTIPSHRDNAGMPFCP